MRDPSRATSFGSRADPYDSSRPAPPDEALDWVLPTTAVDVIDLGAGTGLLTRALLARQLRVVAVDPDPRMLAVLSRQSPDVRTVAGAAEAIPLPDSCADVVLASAAWHWFDPEKATPEIARVLRPGGRIATIGTILDPEVDWVAEIMGLLVTERGYPASWELPAGPTGEPFTELESEAFRSSFLTDHDRLITELSTWSPVLSAAPDERDDLLRRARSVIAERFPDGRVPAVHRSMCFRAQRT